MSLTVARALELEIFRNCRLLTGRAGLENEILWVNILEILDDLSHIEPGELLITTAHDFNALSESKKQSMIELFAARKLAAVAIQTGHYIKEIPDSFIRFSEEHNIPLIEIPPEISFKSLTRILMNELIRSSNSKLDPAGIAETGEKLESELAGMKKLWQKLIENEEEKNLYLNMGRLNLSYRQSFIALALTINRADSDNPELAGEIRPELFGQAEQAIAQLLKHYHIPFLFGPSDRKINLAIQSDQLNERKSEPEIIIVRRLFEELNLLFPGSTVQIGYSNIRGNMGELKQALEEADRALQAVGIGLLERTSIAAYKDMGLYRLIMGVKNTEALWGIFYETTAPLLEYDRRNKGNLLETLKAYLHSGSIKKSSEVLFIHRHTMKYRLEQIRKLTGYNPYLPADALQLNIGLHVYHYLAAINLLHNN